MRVTRRYWAWAALGGFLAALAVLLDYAPLLLGAVGIGAWLLARQYRFVRCLSRTDDELTIEQSLGRRRAWTNDPVSATLTASLAGPSRLSIEVTATPPIAAGDSTADERTVRLDPGDLDASTTFTVESHVAGAFEFEPPTVDVTDPDGLFGETVNRGDTSELVVEPTVPRNVHVGAAGEGITSAYGEHKTGQMGSGIDPAEVREYVPGDAAKRIDWKATARLNHPHVREYETETDRVTVIMIDHREAMADGPEGETKLDYAREVALGFLNSARELDDPIGLYAVGDAGLTNHYAPEASTDRYTAVRRRLHDLRPTTRDQRDGGGSTAVSPGRARQLADYLDADESAFGTTLRPYFETSQTYVQRIQGDPLFKTARSSLRRLRGTVWLILLTDDTRKPQVRETVRVARRGGNHVLAFLTPSVLFDPGGLVDLEAAYERYVDFEEFRRDLNRFERVSAFEVAPGDRIDALLAARRDRRDSPVRTTEAGETSR